MEMESVIGNNSTIGIVKDPFKKDCLKAIHIFMGHYMFGGGIYFKGNVEFQNGNTNAKQEFEGENLTDVFVKVRDFCMSLK